MKKLVLSLSLAGLLLGSIGVSTLAIENEPTSESINQVENKIAEDLSEEPTCTGLRIGKGKGNGLKDGNGKGARLRDGNGNGTGKGNNYNNCK